jgi:hypothetical protein
MSLSDLKFKKISGILIIVLSVISRTHFKNCYFTFTTLQPCLFSWQVHSIYSSQIENHFSIVTFITSNAVIIRKSYCLEKFIDFLRFGKDGYHLCNLHYDHFFVEYHVVYPYYNDYWHGNTVYTTTLSFSY